MFDTRLQGDVASILRFHIVMIAMAATLTFGWLFTGAYPVLVTVLVGLDWLLINLLNRVSDVEEDTLNVIRGTDWVARAPRRYLWAWLGIQAFSLALGAWLVPWLTPLRAVVQLIGVGYSYPIVPVWTTRLTWRGWKRFKDLYFFKNFMSAVLFVLTVFLYPLVAANFALVHPGGSAAVVVLVAFFLCFEITFEILYDLRDLEGDRAAGVPTYPVVHGTERSRQIIDVLLALALSFLTLGVSAGWLGMREALFAAAPVIQFFFYRPRFARGMTRADCINVTHLGTMQLAVFLLGTWLWVGAGMPANVYVS